MYKVHPKYLSNELQDILNIYDVKGVLPQIVGGYSYINQEFPADIDLIESIHFHCHTKCQDYAKIFQNIIKKIVKKPRIFLADFKAGYDPVLIQLKKFDPTKIEDLNHRGLISEEQRHQLVKLKGKKYQEYARLIYTLRWNEKEILRGIKGLSGGRKIGFNSALTDGSMTKIDLIAPIDGFLREITNVFFIYQDETLLYNITSTYLQRIDDDLEKYSGKMFRDSMKYVKRLWSKNFALNNIEMLTRIAPHFHSNAAKLYQIKAEAETIVRLLEIKKDVSCVYDRIIDQIDGFKNRIGHLNFSDENQTAIKSAGYIDRIYHNSNRIKCEKNHRSCGQSSRAIIKNLTSFIKEIKPLIERESSEFLESIR